MLEGRMERLEFRSSAFASPIFAVYAGASGKRFLAHSKLLSLSPTLRKIVDGNWRDSKDCVINLAEWEEPTVEQLLEWLYSGYYTVSSIPMSARGVVMSDDEVAEALIPIIHQQLRGRKLSDLLPRDGDETESDVELSPDCVPDHHQPLTPLQDIRCSGPRDDGRVLTYPAIDSRAVQLESLCKKEWGHTLLPDAKAYVLAQYLQLVDLKRYAFHHIQDTLVFLNQCSPGPQALTRTIALAHYVYSNTDSLNNSEEPLRDLISTFVAEWFLKMDGPQFERLIAGGGEFAVDVTRKLRRHWLNILDG